MVPPTSAEAWPATSTRTTWGWRCGPFDGLCNAPTNRLAESNTSLRPWPQMGLWWDGDITMELFDSGKIEKWDPDHPRPTSRVRRQEQTWDYGGVLGPRGQHNPAYRDDMTVKGCMQSRHAGYFLGVGMTPPPRPNITHSGR